MNKKTDTNEIDEENIKLERRMFLQATCASALTVYLSGCTQKEKDGNTNSEIFKYLKNFLPSKGDNRQINPKEDIDWLKKNVFTHGELDNLPKHAIILHDAKVEQHLQKQGFNNSQYIVLETGSTDPNLVYIVRRNSGKDFIVNRGLPGAGGIATQAAELYAMGVEYIVHVGTCGLIGVEVKEGMPIISQGSYKDIAAILLTQKEDENEIIARPSPTLTNKVMKTFSRKFCQAVGFTIPIYYFQPTKIVNDLVTGEFYSDKQRPGYVEMEAASLFMTAKLMGKHAASLVVGSDRYYFNGKEMKHELYDVDCDIVKNQLFEESLRAFDKL